jgi:hypothetical protein
LRVEVLPGLENDPEALHGRRHLRRELPGKRRGNDLPATSNKERVADQPAQSRQRVADSRGRDMQPLCGAHHRPLDQHVMQHEDEIEIDSLKTHCE